MLKSGLQKKADTIFYQTLGLVAVFLAGLILLGVKLYPRLVLVSQGLNQKIDLICGCANHWQFTNHPFIFSFLILLGVFLAGFTGFIIFKIARSIMATRRFIAKNLERRQELSLKLKNAAGRLGLSCQLVEVDKSELAVFCFGFWRPKICLSSGLIDKLNQEELTAVLLHERHHLLTREPVKTLLMKAAAGVLFFVPVFEVFFKKYVTYTELAADERATDGFKNKMPLARALYKIIKWEEDILVRQYLMVSFFSHITEERINKLVDNDYRPQFKFLNFKAIIGVLIFAAVFLLVDSALNSPQISAAEAGAFCPMTQEESIHYGQCSMAEPMAALSCLPETPAAKTWSCQK